MPLGSVGPFLKWLQDCDPPYIDARSVEVWILNLGDNAVAYPSVPYDTSDQPRSEVRNAVIGQRRPVEVWYKHTYAMDIVDLLLVRWEPRVT